MILVDIFSQAFMIALILSGVSKVGNRIQGWPEGSLFQSYYTKL